MDFAVIGTLSSYVKQKNLMFAAKHKIRTGQTLTNANGNLISANLLSTFDKLSKAAKTSNDQSKQLKLRRIKQKLHAGQKLSDEELGFLRVNDPKTYKKAKHVEEAREDLKAELKNAKSKSEAREAMTRAMLKASAEAMSELSALGQVGGIQTGGNSISTGGEISAESNTNCADAQTFTEANQSIQASDESKSSQNEFGTQKNSDADKFTPEDIMEKYIWTIRALEDEWSRFTNSDEYKNLPNHLSDEVDADKKINRKFLLAATAYRKSMKYSLNVA